MTKQDLSLSVFTKENFKTFAIHLQISEIQCMTN